MRSERPTGHLRQRKPLLEIARGAVCAHSLPPNHHHQTNDCKPNDSMKSLLQATFLLLLLGLTSWIWAAAFNRWHDLVERLMAPGKKNLQKSVDRVANVD